MSHIEILVAEGGGRVASVEVYSIEVYLALHVCLLINVRAYFRIRVGNLSRKVNSFFN